MNFIDDIYFDYIPCDLVAITIKNENFRKSLKKYIKGRKINKNIDTVFYIYYQIFSKLLILNTKLKKKVKSFISILKNYPFIGIQIRLGNDELQEEKRSDEKDVELMINLAKKYKKYKMWYLTGDSQKLKKKLCQIYNNIIVYSLNKTKHYAKYTKDFSIIIEHEILSQSSVLIVSKSTYGFTASLKSGLLLNNGNKNIYVVNNSSFYDIRQYYIK